MRIIFIFALFFAPNLYARPISYAGGSTIMQENDGDMNALHIHYSPKVNYSIGYRGEYWRDEQWQFHGLQLNYLAKRINKPASQANIYLKSALGVAHSDYGTFSSEQEAAGFIGVAADWEDRRYFLSYENRATYAGDIDKFFMQKARVGITPYIGDYGDLHTWLMLQVEHNPSKEDQYTFTPLIRLFHGEYLAEAGISDRGEILFNWIIRL